MEQKKVKGKINFFAAIKCLFKGLNWKKVLKVVTSGLFFFAFLLVGGIVFLSLQSKASGKIPTVFGYQIFSVSGSSMEPSINRGSVIFIKQPEDMSALKENDIITFVSGDENKTVVTHRIVEVVNDGGRLSFITRGDANDINDFNAVHEEYVFGQVKAYMPYLGFLMDFAKTGAGLVVLIVIPGVLIILLELLNLFREIAALKKRKREALLEKLRDNLLAGTTQGGRE